MAYKYSANDYSQTLHVGVGATGRDSWTYELKPWAIANVQAERQAAREARRERAESDKRVAALKAEYESKYNQAKDANESRYKDIISGYDQRYSDVMQQLAGMGDAERNDVRNAYRRSYANSAQGMINSGLMSSTTAPALNTQVARQESNALAAVHDNLQKIKSGYMAQMTQDKLGFMERRTDEYPSQSLYIELMKMIGDGTGAGIIA